MRFNWLTFHGTHMATAANNGTHDIKPGEMRALCPNTSYDRAPSALGHLADIRPEIGERFGALRTGIRKS